MSLPKGYARFTTEMVLKSLGFPEGIELCDFKINTETDTIFVRVTSAVPIEGFTAVVPEGGAIPAINDVHWLYSYRYNAEEGLQMIGQHIRNVEEAARKKAGEDQEATIFINDADIVPAEEDVQDGTASADSASVGTQDQE